MSEEAMKKIVTRIRERRNELNYSFQDLADLTGMSKSTLQRYETGGIKNIPLDKLKGLAAALRVSPEWIMGWTDEKDPTAKYEPAVPAQDLFALKVKGHSMEPRIFDGDTVIVKKQDDVQNGEIAVVEIDGAVTVKKVMKQDSGIILVGLNAAAFSPKAYGWDQVKIIGKVIEVRGSVDDWNR